jgi:type II secretory pathway pseudopilin PulG
MARRRQAGLSLTEVCVIVAVVGVLVAVFVPAFLREVRTSRIAEAGEMLGTLHRGAAAYYDASQHTPSGVRFHCLPDAAGPFPLTPGIDAQPGDPGAAATPGSPTWRALGFAPLRPLRYSYTFAPASSGCAITATDPHDAILVLTAEGDLDGDGERSHFERRDGVDARGNLVPLDVLYVRDRVE